MTTWRIGCLCEVYCKSQKTWYIDGRVETIGCNWIGVRFNNDTHFKKVKQTSYNVIPRIDPCCEIGSFCEVYSKSEVKWYRDGRIDSKGTNWVKVRFDRNKRYKKVLKLSNHIRSITTDNKKLDIGCDCLIYSMSIWCNGVIIDIHFRPLMNGFNKWLSIQYYDPNNTLNVCQIQMHSNALKYIDYTSINPTKLIINGFHPPSNPYFPWTKLHDVAQSMYDGTVAIINDKEFIMSTIAAIYKYNMDAKLWTLFFKYPDDWQQGNYFKIAYDQFTSKLYLWSGILRIVDMKSPKHTVKIISERYHMHTITNSGYLVNTSNEIHIIGADHYSVHLIFNKHNEQFEPTMKHFENYEYISFAVYLSLKQCILIRKGGILMYSLKHKVWEKMYNLRPELINNYVDGVVTKNEKHIVMISTMSQVSTIWILDISEGGYYLRVSKMTLPQSLQSTFIFRRIIETDGGIEEQLLVFGFIRDLYNMNIFDYNRIIPTDIIRLIIAYYRMEWLHILQYNQNEKQKHFAIPMQMILEHNR